MLMLSTGHNRGSARRDTIFSHLVASVIIGVLQAEWAAPWQIRHGHKRVSVVTKRET